MNRTENAEWILMMKRVNDQFEWKEAEFLMDLSVDAFKQNLFRALKNLSAAVKARHIWPVTVNIKRLI